MSAQKIAPTRLTHAADQLIGRDDELARLDKAWTDPAKRVLVVRGIGGEGKTSLVVEWVNRLSARNNYEGAWYFDWSFYSQGTRDQAGASSDPFFAAALSFFGGDEGAQLANSAAPGRDKAAKLLEYIRAHRSLLILDGLEPLQYPPGPLGGRVRDDAMAVLLRGLAQSSDGLCVITTREPLTDLARFQDTTAPVLDLECLSEAAGADVLRRLLEPTHPKGVHQVKSTFAERVEIVRGVRGHALTLRLLGGFIHKFLRDVRRWREVDYSKADAEFLTNPNVSEARYGHAFRTIEAYERWLAGGGVRGARQMAALRLMGLFDRPAVGSSLAVLRAEPVIPGLTEPLVGLTAEEWSATLSELEECGLVSVPRASASEAGSHAPSLDAHPLLREYFARRLRGERLEAWHAGHRRLFEHLCATTKEGNSPTLSDLQPLYQAVAHGCHAGLQQQARAKVYRDRIVRGKNAYSTKKLGAFGSDLGAIACFFETPWTRVSSALPDDDRAWLLNEAAMCLRALGRVQEALEPIRAATDLAASTKDWERASVGASNLSQLELTLGDVGGAVRDAEQAVTFADRSGDASQRLGRRAAHAEALHQSGRRTEAEALFREAERMQAERQPQYPLLYSVRGFRYCDLLLAAAERAAWSPDESGQRKKEMLAACRDVTQRTRQTLRWVENARQDILSPALDRLTLGRSALFEAILSNADLRFARAELDAAVSGLRCAGDATRLPHSLLARAWLRAIDGRRSGPNSAQEDLDEAWEIAERGSMRLFLADILLYRARLFAHEAPYPWAESAEGTPRGPKDDLEDARRLIEKHGYGRRKGELEDTLAASQNWPDARRPLALPAHTLAQPVGGIADRPVLWHAHSTGGSDARDERS